MLQLRLRTRAERINPHPRGWQVQTSAGPPTARQVIVATGHDYTPHIPGWPGLDRYAGHLLHTAGYRNAQAFTGAQVAVAGAGCSGLEIAYDLAQGGATRVWVCVRTQPNIMLRRSGGLPGDLPAIALLHLPPGIADRAALLVHRLTIGYLPQPGQIGHMGRQARQAARAIRTGIRHDHDRDRDPGTGQKASQPPPAAPARAG